MCPFCIAAAALVAGKVAAAGGLAVVVARPFRKKQAPNPIPAKPESKEDQNGKHPD
jgi:hypothetical protein